MAETLLQLADLQCNQPGPHVRRSRVAERALAIVERLGDRRLTAEACYVIGNVRARGNDVAAGRTSLERALGLAQDLDEPALGAEICGYLANVYAWSGEFDRSREYPSCVRNWPSARRTHFCCDTCTPGLPSTTPSAEGGTKRSGFFAVQAEHVDSLCQPRTAGQSPRVPRPAALFPGRFADAERDLREAVELLRPTGSGTLLWHLGRFGLVLRGAGPARRGWGLFRRAAHACRRSGRRVTGARLRLRASGGRYARLGMREQAAGCYDKLLPFRGMVSPIWSTAGSPWRRWLSGDFTAARKHFVDAEEAARKNGLASGAGAYAAAARGS